MLGAAQCFLPPFLPVPAFPPATSLHADLVDDCTRLDPYARPSSRDILMRLKSLGNFAGKEQGP